VVLSVFDRNLRVLTNLLDGIDEDAARIRLFEGGSHLHWLLGHLVASRDGLLVMLGLERVWEVEAARPFDRGSVPDTDLASVDTTVVVQLERLHEQQARLARAVATAADATLERTSGSRTVGGWFEFLAWHETYHLGQVTLYRRAAGLPSPIG
jgi:uncharacterized damage-inducible protein DinB